MNLRRSIAGFALVLLTASSTAVAREWQTFVDPLDNIFPALELATATMPPDPEEEDPSILGDQHGFIGVYVDGAPGTRFDLTIRIPGYARDSRLSGTLPRGVEGPFTLSPTIAWDFQALGQVRQARPALVEFELALGNAPPEQRSQRVRLRSVNDVLYFIDSEDDAEDLDFNWLFAAFVNEDHPIVDEILRDALATGIVESFSGYQAEDPDDVLAQVHAIWHVLQQRGIRYSSITRTSSEHGQLHSQHVRFLDESIAMAQANCVDGTVLLASILRKIDIHPVLVLVPGHMFLGFQLDEEGEEMAFLETTMLGDVHEGRGQRLQQLRQGRQIAVNVEASLESFAAALDEGERQIEEAGDAFDDEDNLEYQFIDVQAAREAGVMPIVR
ncbi:MAG: hypothetical protein MUE46_12730 [Xanthomonadales bacterium]|jgi:hypothetical protein|nr:hypothetical protein [Xanthomonadales bacterium]